MAELNGFTSDPYDRISELQRLLADVYRDTGDLRTILRELVQNADDARARRLVLELLPDGLPGAGNPLLRAPALVAINDGPFRREDERAMLRAIGGSKASDLEKVGRFGLGLRSVFHLCEAFVFVGRDVTGPLISGGLNPWAGTEPGVSGDPLFQDWNTLGSSDVAALERRLDAVTGAPGSGPGLLVWIPLRQPEHVRGRYEGELRGIGDRTYGPRDWADWLSDDREAAIALLLAQSGHLEEIVVQEGGRVACSGRRSGEPLPRYKEADAGVRKETVAKGAVFGDRATREVVRVVRQDDTIESLRALKSDKGWPMDDDRNGHHRRRVPRKAFGHAAVTIVATPEPSDALRVRWAVFFPLDDRFPTESHSSIEVVRGPAATVSWDVLLHGYYTPSQDRQSIPGAFGDTEEPKVGGQEWLRFKWNASVRDAVCLPLVPRAVSEAARSLDVAAVRSLVARLRMWANARPGRFERVTAEHHFLAVAAAGGVSWQLIDAAAPRYGFLGWLTSPRALRAALAGAFPTAALVCDAAFEALAPPPSPWSIGDIERLLDGVSGPPIRTSAALAGLGGALEQIRGELADKSGFDEVLARWWLARLAAGDLEVAEGSSAAGELRPSWEHLASIASSIPLVHVPVTAWNACKLLAAAVGRREQPLCFLPLPFGERDEAPELGLRLARPALAWLGRLLASHDTRARVALAESLISRVDAADVQVDRELMALPLFGVRARRPGQKSASFGARSLESLLELGVAGRCFALDRLNDEETEDGSDGQLTGARQKAQLLADAMDDDIYYVRESALTRGVRLPPLTVESVVSVIGAARRFSPSIERRLGLVEALAGEVGAEVRLCQRRLVAGDPLADESTRLEVEPNADRRRAAGPLLRFRGIAWQLVPTIVTDRFTSQQLEEMGLLPLDLPRRAREAVLAGIGPAHITDEEADALIEMLAPQRLDRTDDVWERLPIHRQAGGKRGPLHAGCVLVSRDFAIPPELAGATVVLEPLPQHRHLYWQQEVNEDWAIRRIFADPHPSRFASLIFELASKVDRQLLLERPWLPVRSGLRAEGIVPNAVVFLDGPFERLVPELRDAGAFVSDVASLSELALEPGQVRTLRTLVDIHASREGLRSLLDRLVRDVLRPTSWRLLPSAGVWKDHGKELIDSQPQLAGLLGWRVFQAARNLLAEVDDAPELDRLGQSLCGPMDSSSQLKLLSALAQLKAPLDSRPRALFIAVLRDFVDLPDFTERVLPNCTLPTQDGHWRSPAEIAVAREGLVAKHLLARDLYPVFERWLRFGVVSRGAISQTEVRSIDRGSAARLRSYFADAQDVVDPKTVGAFLALMGPGAGAREDRDGESVDGQIDELAREWLQGVSPRSLRARLEHEGDNDDGDRWQALKIWVKDHLVAGGETVETLNLLGAPAEFAAASTDSVFAAGTPTRDPSAGFWVVQLQSVNWRAVENPSRLIQNAAREIAARLPGFNASEFDGFWAEFAEGSQVAIGPARQRIILALPLILRQLGAHHDESLHADLMRAEHAIDDLGLADTPQDKNTAYSQQRRAVEALGDRLAKDKGVQKRLAQRARDKIEELGYSTESVLFELFQNADDSYWQRVGSDSDPCPLEVNVSDTVLEATHWGRPINDTLGQKDSPEWDQDLFFMLLPNLTAKGQAAPDGKERPTGRFGLGFKSVHLISHQPRIESGFLAFEIVAGILPEPVETRRDMPAPRGSARWRATRFTLPLRQHRTCRADLLTQRFRSLAHILVAFSKRIRRVSLGGEEFTRPDTPVDGTGNWYRDRDRLLWRPILLPTSGLYVDLDHRVAAATATKDQPFLWNVTPTRETWNLGYAVNGPFKLDPGRTRVEYTHDESRRAAAEIGRSLGDDLVRLHDALGDTDAPLLTRLWTVLAGRTPDDPERRSFWLELHGGRDASDRRGLSKWCAERSIVPTGLFDGLPQVLPALNACAGVLVAAEALADSAVQAALFDCAPLKQDSRWPHLVSRERADYLQELGFATTSLTAGALLSALPEKIEPGIARDLIPICHEGAWRSLREREPGAVEGLQQRLRFKSADGNWRSAGTLIGPDLPKGASTDDRTEQALCFALAPVEQRLHPDYTGHAVTTFATLGVGISPTAQTLVDWIRGRPEPNPGAIVEYLDTGRLRDNVAGAIRRSAQTFPWASSREAFRRWYGKAHSKVEGLLFHDEPESARVESVAAPVMSDLARIWREWKDPGHRQKKLGEWHRLWYPDAWTETRVRRALTGEGVSQTEHDDAWALVLVLATAQRLGRRPEQHRGFVQSWMDSGYWARMFHGEAKDWLAVLEDWARSTQGERATYEHWLALLPSMYILWRWLGEYREHLLSFAKSNTVQFALAPRIDPAQQLGGVDAPSLGAAVKRRAWVIRELVRLGALPHRDELTPFCFQPTRLVLESLRLPDRTTSQDVHHAVCDVVGLAKATMHGAFDIPIYLDARERRRSSVASDDEPFDEGDDL